MKDFSQFGEQAVITNYFAAQGITKGNVLSIGENDGETLSNVRALILSGWGGVLFEPAKPAFDKLEKLYEDNLEIELRRLAVHPTTGVIKFYQSGPHLSDQDSALLSTTNPLELARWKGTNNVFTETEVDAIRWEDYVKANPGRTYEFVNIDAEGSDYVILCQMDLNQMGVKMLCIEWNSDKKTYQDITAYMAYHGFKMHWSNSVNLIFVKP